MARTPDLSWDQQRERYCINWRIPIEVQALLSRKINPRISRDGAWFRDRFPKSTSPDQARHLKAQRLAEFYGLIDAAKARLGSQEGADELAGYWAAQKDYWSDRVRAIEARALPEIARLEQDHAAAVQRQKDEAALKELTARLGISVTLPSETRVYTFDTCIEELWVPKRRRAGKPVDETTVERLMHTKVRRIVKHLGHNDMGKVTREDLETYFDQTFIGKATGTVRDHMIMIIALFNVAHDRKRITQNPAEDLTYSKDNDNAGRPFMPSERVSLIRAARDCDDETVKWLWLLGAHYGPRIAEFAEASVWDIVLEDGVPVVFLDKLHRTGRERTLKTPESRRWLPIHSAMRMSSWSE